MMTQTAAIFLDAYRELNAKRLFWFVLALSGLVVAIFAMIGNNERGLTFLTWTIEIPPLSTRFLPSAELYKMYFVNMGLGIWLTWIATILALISTASVFPDFLAGGAIEMTLSKPIGRLRLFLTKYLSGLLFVALQVGVFSVASLLVLGLRGGVWEFKVLLAVPLVVVIFSSLFCMCVLFGVVFRSTIAALMLTLLAWGMIFVTHTADAVLLGIRAGQEQRQVDQAARVEATRKAIAELEATPDGESPAGAAPAAAPDAPAAPSTGGVLGRLKRALEQGSAASQNGGTDREQRLQTLRERLERQESRRAELEKNGGTLEKWHAMVFGLKTFLPKTQETVGLMTRWMIEESTFRNLQTAGEDGGGGPVQVNLEPASEEERVDDRRVQARIQEELRSRSVAWVLGTTLGFQVVVTGLAAWLFCRRDF
ncbi:MAG: hypothetical protein SFZ24_04540 [Planctomycetota bacterium]|nr:hypothetical protein [Planctomycetota bacterium]